MELSDIQNAITQRIFQILERLALEGGEEGKMQAVLFQTHLLAIAIEQIHVIVTDFCVFEVQTNSSNKSNNRAGNTLFMIRAGLQEIIYPISTDANESIYSV